MAEYIEREDLIRRLELSIKSWGRDCNSNAPVIVRTYQDVLHRVKNIPAADVVEVRRGEWIKNQSIADVCGEYRCSLCGLVYCEADPVCHPYKYCPECGAKNE